MSLTAIAERQANALMPVALNGAASLGELSALTIRSNAAKESYGYLNQAWSAQAQANLDQSNAQADMMAGLVGGAGDLISGIGDEQKWAAYAAKNGLPK